MSLKKTNRLINTRKEAFLTKSAFSILYTIFLFFFTTNISFGEGTKQLMPTATDNGYIQLFDQNTITRPFASFNCPLENRLNIRICNSGEIIYMGFQQTNNDVYFRLKDPSGATVPIAGLTAVAPNTYLLPTGGMGRITSYNQAFNGPSAIVGAGGYNAITYTSTMIGDYYVEFNPVSPTVVNPLKRVFNYFDITVASPANAIINGRVWSETWDFTTNAGPNQFKAIMHVYSDDGIVTALNFNGMQPFGFTMSCNATGCTNTGNTSADRASRFGNSTYAQYKIFLNDPDPSCFPTGTFGTITAPSTVTGCGTNKCINVSVDKPGNVGILLDLNGITGFQQGTKDRQLYATVVPGANCIPWDGKDGFGNIVTSGISFSIQIDYFNGLTHLPLFDVEDNPNGYIVTLSRPAGPVPRLFWDDAAITTGTATDGLVNLTGCSLATGCHRWRNRGNNANPETINTWWYANIISDTLQVSGFSITADADTRNHGTGSANDTTVCGLINPKQLSGGVTGATGGIWSTSGTGSFSPNGNTLNASYTPTASDIAAGFVYLKLTSTGNGACPAMSDSLKMTFQPAPSVNAGSPQTKCANNASTVLAGSFTNASGIRWTGGTGTFVPNNTTTNATYNPSAAEITAGTVTLTITTQGNGVCNAVTDQMVITIQAAPTANAGTDLTSCSNNPNISLAGTVTNATSQNWSGGTGTFNPGNTLLTATYTPSAAEITAGSATLTLNANRAGCITVSDQMRITISTAPVVNAGSDQSVCNNNSNVTLNGTVTNTATFSWSGGAGTYTPNNTTLNAVYTPTLTERNSGSVTLTLTATKASCNPVSDQMVITITHAPIVSAGNDKTVCANNPLVNLTGTSSTGSGTWSGGCGIFVPGPANLNNQYTPCISETTLGTAALVLTSTGNGNCIAVSDTMIIIVTPAPTANANTDRSVCANNPALTLAGATTNASSGIWSGGTGSFSPASNVLNAQYTPSAAEITAGTVTLTLTANRTTCNPVTDQMVISITPKPTVNAGSDRSVCHNNSNVSLNGVVTIATGGTWSGGLGTFAPNANTLNATYTPTLAERNAGTVTLTLTSTGNGTCNAVNDQMVITITPAPTVNAGTDKTVCANNPTTTLGGTVNIATGGTWSGGGTFNPNASTLNPSFTPSAAQITAGSATLTLTTAGNGNCNPLSDQVIITIIPAPVTNAGTDRTVCADNPAVVLAGTVTTATGGTWSGGAGSFTPNSNTLNATYTPSAGEVNTGTVTLTLTSTGNGLCNPVSDAMTITITPAPTVNAGADKTVCGNTANVPLTGTITVATGATWTSTGTGSFSPNANTLSASYVPSAADRITGNVTLTLRTTGNGLCNAVSDALIVTFTTVPTINAGPDQIVCANNLPIKLNASGSAAAWTGGSGTFSPSANALNAIYTPTTGEIASGAVNLTITTIASGACPVVSDQVRITIPPAPIANAGTDITMCGNLAGASLNGVITNASGGFWSTSGTGSFVPNATTLNATYRPSALDKTNGNVTLTLTTTGNGTCTGHSDPMILTIQPAIAVNAGPDQTTCSNLTAFPLNGIVTNATGGTWSTTGTGSFNPNNVTLNASYVASAADLASASVTLTLTSTGNGVCPAQTDKVIYNIRQVPLANAGAPQTICADVSSIALNGTVTRATGGLWSSSGSGIFSNPAALNTTYNFSAADKAAGSITFTLTTTGNGICNPATAQKVVTINPAPTVSAGSDKTICADAGTINLNGTVTVATGGVWSSSGNGTFNNVNLLNATYTPSANDITNGTVTLSLTTTGNGLCNPVSDQLIIAISPAPVVNAGFDQTICANASANLNGVVTIASGGKWTSNGSGSFSPDANTLNATYQPSSADTSAGSVILTLTTTGNGTCNAYSDQVNIIFQKVPHVFAGPDQTICADSNNIIMNGNSVNTGGILWTTSGSGNFFPSATAANANYVPSPIDKVSGNIILTITSTNNGSCVGESDRMILNISPAPTVDAGADQVICADSAFVNLNGNFTVASGAIWASSGTGTFTPNNTSMNARYTPSANDKLAGTVSISLSTTGNGTCKAVSDNLTISITPAPTVNAGTNQTVCANTSTINLNGSVTTASGGNWSASGTGGFSPNSNALNATYFVTPADTAAGSVILTLTTTGNGTCNAVTDQIRISFDRVPLVNAGADQTVCASVTGIALTGKVANAIGGTWTGGNGSFAPNNNSLIAAYVPSAADTIAGNVTLTLSTTGSGTCPSVSDQMVITINPLPIINAGPDQVVCADAGGVQLSGKLLNVSSASWSTNGTGNFSPNTNDLNALYSPSNADTTAGSIIVTLTSTSGICGSASDNMKITFTPAPTVDAGPDLSVCTGLTAVGINLQGKVTVATGGFWSSNGSGSFSNPNSLNTTYYPTIADEAAGSLTFTLITTGNGSCNFYTDAMTLSFAFPTAMISAGNDTTVCSNGFPVQLKGSGTTGRWSGGLGSFIPNDSTLNARYVPAASEITAGSVSLTITAIGMGACTPAVDQVTISLPQGPTAAAGTDQSLCSNSAPVALNGNVTVASGGTWTSSGSGSFGNPNSVSTTYTPSAADQKTGTVTFTLTTTGNGVCGSSSDKMSVSIIPGPTISAGLDQVVCSNASVKLSAVFTNATSMQWVGGSGTFTANNTSPNAVYTPTPAEITSGRIVLTASTIGTGICPPATDDQIIINFTSAPTANAGTPQNVCASTTNINLSGTVNIATGGFWKTLGTGAFTSSPSLLNTRYRPSSADTAAKLVKLVLTTTGNGTCNSVTDTVSINFTPMPIVDAGPADTICSANIGVALTGHVLNAGGGLWQTLGTGSFAPNATSLTTTYNQSMLDNSRNTVTLRLTSTLSGPCPAVSDFVTIKIITSPFAIINAGLDNSVCADAPSFQLRGLVGHAGGGIWTSNGSGSFTPDDTNLNGMYVPSATDKTNGSVVITLTSTGNGRCTASSDNMIITIAPKPVVSSGSPPNQTICADAKTVNLNGTVIDAAGGIWSTSGTGYFTPNANSLNAIYIPSASDKANGSVGLTLTSTGNGTCNPVKDNFLVTITPAPTVNAGTDIKVCAQATSIIVNGFVTAATGGTWTSSGSGSFANANALSTTYTPSLGDTTSKEILLTLTTTGTSTCNPVNDQVKITFQSVPKVDAGPDQFICSDNSNINLNGTVLNTNSVWSTSGSGSFSDVYSLTSSYSPSQLDTANGSITLTLTTWGNNVCNPLTDQMVLTLQHTPIVNAGSAIICELANGAQLHGTVLNALGGIWKSSGSGSFSLNPDTLNSIYYPSAADVTAGSVTLTLSSTGNGVCAAKSHQTILNIEPMPIANAGQDVFICRGSSTTLAAFTSPNVNYQWSTLGGPVIATTPTVSVTTSVNNVYVLTISNSKGCSSKDTVQVSVFDLPSFNLAAHHCLSNSLIINSNPQNLPAVPGVFQWYRNNSIITGEDKSVISPIEPGNFMITYSYGNCSTSANTSVSPTPILTHKNVTACENSTATITITANVNSATYVWSTGNTGVDLRTITVNVPQDTSYYAATVTDLLGCSNSDSVRVIGIPVPQFNITDSTGACQGTKVILDARPTNIANIDLFNPVYKWFKNTTPLTNTNDSLLVDIAGKYIVNVAIGQCTAKDSSIVHFNPIPASALVQNPKFCKETDHFQLLDAGAGIGYTYLWTPSTGALIDSNTTQTIGVTNQGIYAVTITNKFNCQIKDSTFVREACPPRLFVPNAIIPDSQGEDRTFKVFGDYFINYKMEIFNRWGEVIFMSFDRNESWDGTYLGKPMPLGVYNWVVTYEGQDPDLRGPFRKEGSVTVVR